MAESKLTKLTVKDDSFFDEEGKEVFPIPVGNPFIVESVLGKERGKRNIKREDLKLLSWMIRRNFEKADSNKGINAYVEGPILIENMVKTLSYKDKTVVTTYTPIQFYRVE